MNIEFVLPAEITIMKSVMKKKAQLTLLPSLQQHSWSSVSTGRQHYIQNEWLVHYRAYKTFFFFTPRSHYLYSTTCISVFLHPVFVWMSLCCKMPLWKLDLKGKVIENSHWNFCCHPARCGHSIMLKTERTCVIKCKSKACLSPLTQPGPPPHLMLSCFVNRVLLHHLFNSSDTDTDGFALQVH